MDPDDRRGGRRPQASITRMTLSRKITKGHTEDVRSLGSRVDDFMQAPVAAAMFVLADRLGFNSGRLAAPATATACASTAMRDLNPWDGEAAASRVRAVALVQPLRDLVTAVVTDVRNGW
jgi:hypothetical protein